MIGFFQFHIVHSKIMLIACADQLLYILSLIKLCSACVKQNTAVKTALDACSLLTKNIFSGLVGERPSSLIFNFQQVIKPFLVWNIYFTFFLTVVDCSFYYYVTYTFQSASILYSFRTSKQEQYLKFKWTITSWKYSRPNIA